MTEHEAFQLCRLANARVSDLKSENERLRQALATIIVNGERNPDTTVRHLVDYAREQLGGEG